MENSRQQELRKKNLGSALQCTNHIESRKRKRSQYTKPRKTSQSISLANNPKTSRAANSFKKNRNSKLIKIKILAILSTTTAITRIIIRINVRNLWKIIKKLVEVWLTSMWMTANFQELQHVFYIRYPI